MVSSILAALACGNSGCPCAQSVRRGHGLTHCLSHRPDTTPSLNVEPGKSVDVVVTCHGGCSQGAVIEALKDRGLWHEVNTGIPFASAASAANDSAPLAERCEVARYRYENADGTHAYDILRFEPKTFRASRTVPEAERVPYHLPEVLAAVAAKQTIFVCEGEKDTDALRALGVVATCNPFGAGKFLDRYAQWLIGANVVIWADKDEPGRAHAKDVAQKLSVAARSVKIIESPVGKDATEWLESGGSIVALLVLVADTPEWQSGERAIWTAPEAGREYRDILQRRIAGDPEHVGWAVGLPSLDREMRYWPGNVWLVAASTGVGKSAFLQTLQRRAKPHTFYFSLEMTRTQVIDRLLSAEAGVDSWKIARGALDQDERRRVYEALDRFERSDVALADNVRSTGSIENILRIARVRFGTRIAYIDYVGLLTERAGDSRYEKMTKVAHELQQIAKATGVCLVIASQVNRKGAREADPPHMEEMRDTGALEEIADVVLAIGRAAGASEAKLAIHKNRWGIAGWTLPLVFDSIHTQFIEVAEANMQKADRKYTRDFSEDAPRLEPMNEIPF